MTEQVQAPINISYTAELPGNKALQLTTFVSRDAEPKEINSVLDKVRVAVERQFAFGAIEKLRMQLETEEKIAFDHADRIAKVDQNIKNEWANSNRRGDVQLTAKQRQDQAQAYQHAEESKLRIAKVKEQIAEYQAMIGA